ncbi:MAG: ParB/RepB/Spo0J family partition protein [Candidatus Cloacimonetes bacterium]|nr:ParB/RepB/Spo0J family partition protein [Candidatus Cloacimonadota bacterium]
MSQPKRALGKGLGALLKTSNTNPVEEGKIVLLPLSSVVPNPFQPRSHFSTESIQELADSIDKNGLLQPITVRQSGEVWQIVYGERRFRAYTLLGRSEIPAYIQDYDDQQMLVNALVENIQREDLNPIEEAVSYQRLAQELQLTHEELASSLSKSRTYITNSLRLLRLPVVVLDYVKNKVLSPGAARALLAIESEELLKKAANDVIVQGLNVRQVENFVKDLLSKRPETKSRKSSGRLVSASLQTHLQDKIKVPFSINANAHGIRLELRFETEEEIEEFLSSI